MLTALFHAINEKKNFREKSSLLKYWKMRWLKTMLWYNKTNGFQFIHYELGIKYNIFQTYLLYIIIRLHFVCSEFSFINQHKLQNSEVIQYVTDKQSPSLWYILSVHIDLI